MKIVVIGGTGLIGSKTVGWGLNGNASSIVDTNETELTIPLGN